ncbi:MAG: glycosyltransferase [Candidatus Aminicenantes bacterium]|nr:glycosyltransferase [Candidatus Aminicenantes bacterium]
MTFFSLLRDGLFIFSVVFIWLMLLYQFLLTLGGLFFWKREKLSRKEEKEFFPKEKFPLVSILIPARNEALVIEGLLERLASQDYPQEKMEIIVVNDGSSDNTGEVVAKWKGKNSLSLKLIDVPVEESGRGKGAALNRALNLSQGEIVAVYDADNLPEKDSLKKLVIELVNHPELAAVTGLFRAYNRHRNLLTRLINLESLAFQWIIQAGRNYFLKIAFLAGTNYVIRRSLLEKLGGWEERALTEDAELTIRIYEQGWRVKFLPTAVTWEQEPEKLTTWFRQRTRWARGNNELILRQIRGLFRGRFSLTFLELANLFYLYYLFVFAILVSDIFFFLSLTGLLKLSLPGPYLELWFIAFWLFLFEILVALAIEKEDSFFNFLLAILAYFTYTKLWAFVVLRSFFEDFICRREKIWVKTERFPELIEQKGDKSR